jgi:hypothetical protein
MRKKKELENKTSDIESNTKKYTKDSIVKSEKYGRYKDLLETVLADDELYSFYEVEKKIEKFMKGKVN